MSKVQSEGQAAKRSRQELNKANAVDLLVGMRLRLRRSMLGLDEEGLARLVGVTVQQVADFEAGAERIGASTLFILANKLEVPITWFYDGASIESHLPIDMARNSAGRAVQEVTDALKKREGEALLLFYFSEMDTPMRERLVEIARVLADS
jgi:transcriptional regulator with XRE-family HTH domain